MTSTSSTPTAPVVKSTTTTTTTTSPPSPSDPATKGGDTAHYVTSLLVGLVCVGLGVPIWWKTTEIHRAPLSHSEIDALPATPLTSLVELEVVVVGGRREEVSLVKVALLGQRLKERMEAPTEGKSSFLTIRYKGQVRACLGVLVCVFGC